MQQITMSVDDIEEIVKRRIKRAMERPVPTLLRNLCHFYPLFFIIYPVRLYSFSDDVCQHFDFLCYN